MEAKFFCHMIILTFTMSLLTSCGGGGGKAPTTDTFTNLRAQSSLGTFNAATEAAKNLPSFGSVTQSSRSGVAGITTDSANVSFDGNNASLSVTRGNNTGFNLSSLENPLGSESPITPIFNDLSAREYILTDLPQIGFTAAWVNIHWSNTDSSDYLAAGYWIHSTDNIDTITGGQIRNAEVGAFIDGPEFSGTAPTLPNLGSANYDGNAHGIYSAKVAGTGDVRVGEFKANLRLIADFGANTIRGCVGCTGRFSIEGMIVTASNEINELYEPSGSIRVDLGPTSFGSNGRFRDSNVSLVHINERSISESNGAWGGQFSNIPNSSGNPRVAAGTIGVQWSEPDNNQGALVGSFIGQNQ